MRLAQRLYALVLGSLLLGTVTTEAAKTAKTSQADCPEIVINYSYTPVYPERGNVVKEELRIALPKLASIKARTPEASDEAVKKTLFALKLIATFERGMAKFDRHMTYRPWPWYQGPIYRPMLDASGLPQLGNQAYEKASDENQVSEDKGGEQLDVLRAPRRGYQLDVLRSPRHPEPSPDAISRNKQLAAMLKLEFEAFRDYAKGDKALSSDVKLMDLVTLGLKFAANIDAWTGWGRGGLEGLESMRSFSVAAAPKGLSLSAGGAQDAGHFRKQVEDGSVPDENAFSADGMLRELSLAIPLETTELMAVKPAYLVDTVEQMIYIQLDTGSSVTDASFNRNPTNVTVALDISGSMGATDGTPHQRIEWAKSSLKTLLRKLKKGDTVSIILFDDRTDVFLEPIEVSKIKLAALEARIDAEIHSRGSTDVEKAMAQAYTFARRQADIEVAGRKRGAQVENRIVLISDAGHNAGGTEAGIVKLVNDAARNDIGTTAIGLGSNFKQELVEGFANAKGGNYVFVNTGKEMQGLFDRFDFLVQPVAEDFRVAVKMNGLGQNAAIERAWGVNARPGDRAASFNVPTLFFVNTEGGGGAMVLAIRYGTPTGPSLPSDTAPARRSTRRGDTSGPALPGDSGLE